MPAYFNSIKRAFGYMVVIQISFDNARSIVDALQKGLLIRDDLQNHIADKATLFSQN